MYRLSQWRRFRERFVEAESNHHLTRKGRNLKQLITGALLAFAGLIFAQGAYAQPGNAAPKGTTVDLDKALPTELKLTVGQSVVFENGPAARVSANETDSKGTLLESRPHNTFNQIAAFRATRVGEGEITITYTVQAPGHKPMKPVTIPVKVSRQAKVHSVTYNGPYPKSLTLEPGDQVQLVQPFKGDPGLFDPSTDPSVKNTDSNKSALFDAETPVKRLDMDTIQVRLYTATREGTGDIVFTKFDGTQTGKISVTVKAAAQPKVYTVNFRGPYLPALTLKPGDSVQVIASFKGDPGLFDPAIHDKGSSTDGKGDLFDKVTAVKRIDEDTIQVTLYTAKREGRGEIVFTRITGAEAGKIVISVTK